MNNTQDSALNQLAEMLDPTTEQKIFNDMPRLVDEGFLEYLKGKYGEDVVYLFDEYCSIMEANS